MSRDGSGRRDHEAFDELAVGWALKALEPDDESRFARHLHECSRCNQTVREAQEMTAAMAMAVPMEQPSSALRARIMAAAAATPRDAEVAPPLQLPLRPPGRVISSGSRQVRPRHRPRPRLLVMARGVALAAALALVVGLGVWNVDLRNDRAEAQAFAARQAEVLDELNDRGIYHVAPLETSDGQAVGMVVVHDGAAKVMADGLPVNDAERETLVLWGMRSQLSPVALGTFDVVHSELDVRTVSSTSTVLDAYDGYAISLEPGRRAPSTPTDTIATGTVGS
ncbi:MAG: anti-sigma factor [Geodermatophilaceae bacterium]|nr:anti-sigma factor [Geodermatophilaceae bacterium]MDQ3466019.1 anti-sigma factor [Actinomycetota bacterium]